MNGWHNMSWPSCFVGTQNHSCWKQLENWRRKHRAREMDKRRRLFSRNWFVELAVLLCSTQKMLKPMAKMGRFVHPCCDDEVKILQNAALAIEPSFRTDEIIQGRQPGRSHVFRVFWFCCFRFWFVGFCLRWGFWLWCCPFGANWFSAFVSASLSAGPVAVFGFCFVVARTLVNRVLRFT